MPFYNYAVAQIYLFCRFICLLHVVYQSGKSRIDQIHLRDSVFFQERTNPLVLFARDHGLKITAVFLPYLLHEKYIFR